MVGIYKIQSNTYPNRVYYGRTIDFIKRKNQHISLLKKNKHHSIILQNHFNKHGIKDLFFELVEECAFDKLESVEQEYLNLNNFFNVSKNSAGGRVEKNITKVKNLPISERLVYLNKSILKGDLDAILYWLELRFRKPKIMTSKQKTELGKLYLDLNKSN
jgi:group I intron endonuclease